ncbi:myeloid-associated differentiation marker-like protein 2 [Coregonus clupeaformis]|uniref:myeloid-associated differentiation marker-like protein 2 n=1 Tax=Coregonus clupeaformis TaxID=59861 RepID=UPI001BE071CB|nr:myeloid-associated differentiation marker-like protein 2 [Coregonus clupeaformis]
MFKQQRGILRLLEILLCVILITVVGHRSLSSNPCWVCPLREFLDWDDLTAGLVLLDTLLVLSPSVIYPLFYVCWSCPIPLVATTLTAQCSTTFALEAVTAKQEGKGSYLSTLPGFLKVAEAFGACIIFVFLTDYQGNPGMEWCVIVYSVCFPLTILVIVLNFCPSVKHLLQPLEVYLAGFDVPTILLFTSAATLWPVFSFQKDLGPSICHN